MPIVTPTIHFAGTCESAIALYKEAFGAQVSVFLRYSDANPGDYTFPAEYKDLVYHSELIIGQSRLMMSDDMRLDGQNTRGPIHLTVTLDTAEDVKKAFACIARRGEVLEAVQSTTYSSAMGSVIDEFGVRWGIMTEQTQK